ncbi:Putative vacuolar protein sorting-associated protein VTA1 [Gryllus bimaculatus]|nr:Putative vacuolar protein sorting-associated protein VTA1 [Gryllus bimaculatus]
MGSDAGARGGTYAKMLSGGPLDDVRTNKTIVAGRLYALQCALKIDKKSDEAKVLLVRLMDWLETQKQALADNESITNDIAAQAHIENYALKLFVYADTQDRASNFGKNVVKAFYTSGMLFDVLQTFGELTEEIMQNRKYAKWKAAYIHNCLKNGETPIPGPIQDENNPEDDELGAVGGNTLEGGAGSSNPLGFYSPPPDQPSPYMPPPSASPNEPSSPTPGASPYFPPSGYPSTPSGGVPTDLADLNSGFSSPNIAIPGSNSYPEGSSVVLKPEQITKAQKYCKYAASALNYDDVATAVNYLEKAMKLLKTGVDA